MIQQFLGPSLASDPRMAQGGATSVSTSLAPAQTTCLLISPFAAYKAQEPLGLTGDCNINEECSQHKWALLPGHQPMKNRHRSHGKCISFQSWAISRLPAGGLTRERLDFSPLLSSPLFLHLLVPSSLLFLVLTSLCFVPSPHTYLFFLSFIITFPSLSLFLSSFIWYLPPFRHCLFLLSLSNSIFLPLLLFLVVSLSLSPFLCFPLSPLFSPPSLLTPHS